jgi:hypothetical protein
MSLKDDTVTAGSDGVVENTMFVSFCGISIDRTNV